MARNARDGHLIPRPMIEKAARLFKMLSEPARLEILNQLQVVAELNVQEIVDATGHSQANVSKHLRLLHRENLVARRKEGLYVYYRIADPKLIDICETVCGQLRRRAEDTYRAIAAE